MTPSWYDVLDVDPTASTEQIRTAWKSAIADLEPTDRRFRLLNQAAEALLDPTRRAEHDAALAADAAESEAPAGDSPTSAGAPAYTSPPVVTGTDDTAAKKPAKPAKPAKPVKPSRTPKPERPAARSVTWAPPVWLLAGVFVLVAAVVGVCAWQATIPTDSSVEASTRVAQSTAEKAAVSVLSYDYRDLPANKDAASAYLTPAFRKDYDSLFATISANADDVKPVVTATIVASGIQRVNRAGDRVSVLVFLNRPTTNAQTTTPIVYQDQVSMQMQKVGDDWLVDDMVTTTASE